MGETTTYGDDISRQEAAELLEELARELHGNGTADVRVGNKHVTLQPREVLEYAIEVEERSPMLSSQRQEVTVTLEWKVDEGD